MDNSELLVVSQGNLKPASIASLLLKLVLVLLRFHHLTMQRLLRRLDNLPWRLKDVCFDKGRVSQTTTSCALSQQFDLNLGLLLL